MLRSSSDLDDCIIHALDGPIGHVKDIYFDDNAWVIRYLIVDTGSWLSSRQVLISPMALAQSNWPDRSLCVSITKERVRHSPSIDTDKPVSRQHDPHLRSGKAVLKYDIEASDGGIGHVEGLLLDDETCAIRYLIVNTSNWWLGHQVLIAPKWIKNVSWPDHTVLVNLTRQAVKDAPPYDSAVTFERHAEVGLHKHYERTGYWADEVKLQNPEYAVDKPKLSVASHNDPR